MRTKSIFLLLLLSVAVGCSNRVNVSGKVLYEDDKTPVVAGAISFETETFVGRSGIKPDGSYNIGADREGNGVPPGKYKVTIFANQPYPEGKKIMGPPKLAVNGIYGTQSTTPLEIEVGSKAMTHDFEVKRP